MKALVVTGTRADWGLWTPVLAEMRRRPGIELGIVVTGMHLDDRFGGTVAEIRASRYAIAAEVACTPQGDSRTDMVVALGETVVAMAPVIERQSPDWVLLLGDRGEQLAAALVALHQGLAVAHVHGGERTLGAVDDAIRDMISRIAHLHLVADPSAASRLLELGEAPWRIHVTGAPGLDDLAELRDRAIARPEPPGGVPDRPYAVVIYHPETVGRVDPVSAIMEIFGALDRRGLSAVAIMPNADAGGRAVREAILAHAPQLDGVFPSLPREQYVGLLSRAAVLVGNSSSGLIEAPLLKLPVVNVGERQRGRLRGDNVIDARADRDAIAAALVRALTPGFRAGLSGISPYGSGDASRRIVEAVLAVPIDRRLLIKEVA
jgi:GDP/UDP-N,N'-diacetylbacillosamine 2-epimerase (hydrolysing)